jgi:hypothetical protein
LMNTNLMDKVQIINLSVGKTSFGEVMLLPHALCSSYHLLAVIEN